MSTSERRAEQGSRWRITQRSSSLRLLGASGKAHKVAIVVGARKLLTYATSVVERDTGHSASTCGMLVQPARAGVGHIKEGR